jgi:hypothetical protein
MRSFFPEYKLTKAKEAYDYYLKYAKEHWQEFSIYYQAVLCTVFKRTGDIEIAKKNNCLLPRPRTAQRRIWHVFQ